MHEPAIKLVKTQPDLQNLILLAHRLTEWLIGDLNRSDEPVPDFTESRAKALLRATDLLDDPTRHSFERLMLQEMTVRLALYDLLQLSGLAEDSEVEAMAATTAVATAIETQAEISWLSLTIATQAWKSGYALYQLDPASPPGAYSPAGQLLKRAAYFIRQQVQRSATERDKLGRQVAYDPTAYTSSSQTLETMPDQNVTQPPLPPYYRPPIPVNYPEIEDETIQLEGDEPMPETAVTRGDPIVITTDDLLPAETPPVRQPPISIAPEQVPAPPAATPSPAANVVTPNATVSPNAQFSRSVQRRFSRKREPMKTTKLRIVVQEFPDGPGLYGLQVRVRCRGIKSHVAGTTTREGKFACELPVPLRSGLTYDVEVTWPREMDSEVERKSITLNADRTEFLLPFYQRLKQ